MKLSRRGTLISSAVIALAAMADSVVEAEPLYVGCERKACEIARPRPPLPRQTSIAESPRMMRFAQINNKCDLDGQVPVDVGAFRFAIHRRIFAGALPLKPHGRVDPRCSDVPLQGDGVLLVVSATRSGATFYKQWVHGRRFPHCITIRLRGTIKRYPSDRFERLAKSDLKNHPLRFSVISDGLHTLYNASSLRMVDHFNRGIVFECVNTETAKARSCGTSYPLTDDFDLAYEFFMSELGPESWADLDTRVREFVATLIRPKT